MIIPRATCHDSVPIPQSECMGLREVVLFFLFPITRHSLPYLRLSTQCRQVCNWWLCIPGMPVTKPSGSLYLCRLCQWVSFAIVMQTLSMGEFFNCHADFACMLQNVTSNPAVLQVQHGRRYHKIKSGRSEPSLHFAHSMCVYVHTKPDQLHTFLNMQLLCTTKLMFLSMQLLCTTNFPCVKSVHQVLD